MLKFILLMNTLTWVLTLTACSATSKHDAHFDVLETYVLDDQVSETSGLFCTQKGAITINDSGNSAEIFTLRGDGVITNKVSVAARNQDWESISGSVDAFYIADIGNNSGSRKGLNLYKVNRNDLSVMLKMEVNYEGNQPDQNALYSHDFDGEAITLRDEILLLFSKSWKSGVTRVYRVKQQRERQILRVYSEIVGLPGVVTGADWSAAKQELALSGYHVNALGMFSPFIGILDGDFKIQSVLSLTGFGQVEGICHGPDNELWITQEKSPFSSAKLIKLKVRSLDLR